MTKQKAETKEEEAIEEQVQEDCKDAEKALTTRDACNYTAKEKIRKAAKRLEDKYLKEGREDKIGNISTEIRKYFKNPNHKDYISRILSDIGDGKYVRKWNRTDYEKELLRQFKGLNEDLKDIIIAIEEDRFLQNADEQELERYILGIGALRKMIAPVVDRRWAEDWSQWCDIIENYYKHGSGYASKKSEVSVAKTQETRKITKEQIECSLVHKMNDIQFIVNNFKHFIKMCKEYKMYINISH